MPCLPRPIAARDRSPADRRRRPRRRARRAPRRTCPDESRSNALRVRRRRNRSGPRPSRHRPGPPPESLLGVGLGGCDAARDRVRTAPSALAHSRCLARRSAAQHQIRLRRALRGSPARPLRYAAAASAAATRLVRTQAREAREPARATIEFGRGAELRQRIVDPAAFQIHGAERRAHPRRDRCRRAARRRRANPIRLPRRAHPTPPDRAPSRRRQR